MSRITAVCLILGLCVVLLAAVGYGQLMRLVGPERETLLYDGDVEMDSGGITVTRWGSGEAESVYEATYVGPQVLKVKSQGPYQGVVLRLGRSGDLTEFLASPAGYLDLRLQPAQTQREIQERLQAREERRTQAATRAGRGTTASRGGGGRGGGGRGGGMGGGRGGGMGGARGGGMGGARGGGMGGARGGGMGGARGGGGRGGRGGRGMRGGAGAGTAGTGARAAPQPARPSVSTPGQAPDAKVFVLRDLRVVLFTDRGTMIADSVPVGSMPKDKLGWTRVTIPLSQFKGVEDATSVRAVGIFADQADVFYLGRAALLIDRTPVELTLKAEPAIARVNQLIDFSVELRGGPINPEISWDFEKSDGVQKQAIGPKVKYLYREPGDYLATCTVRDRGGVQSDAVKSIGIRVEGAA